MDGDDSILGRAGVIGVALLVMLSMAAGAGVAVADNAYKVGGGGADDAGDDEKDKGADDDGDAEDDEDRPEAEVTFDDQTTEGETVVVDEVTMEEGGFVVIHDSTLLDGDALGSVIGTSEYLEAGTHEDVEVTLFEGVEGADFGDTSMLEEDETLIAMPHFDTNGNEEYDFVATEGSEDGPYVDGNGDAVVDDAMVTVGETEEDEETEGDDGAEDDMDAGDDNGDDADDMEDMEVTANDVENTMDAMGMDMGDVEEMTGMTAQDIADMLNEMLAMMSASGSSASA